MRFGVGGGFPAEILTNFATMGEGFAWFLGDSLTCRLGPYFAGGYEGQAVGVSGAGITFCWVGLGGLGLVWLLS